MQLTTDQWQEWQEFGWVRIPDALDETALAELEGAVAQLEAWSETDGPGLHHFEMTDNGPALARSEKFADDHAGLDRFLREGVIADTLAELFGGPAALYKEKINYKQPGGAGFAPHQDSTAYRFVDHHISVMVPLDPSTVESGCLYFAPGHTGGQMPTDERGRVEEGHAETLDWRPIEVHPGDLVFFDSYAPHYSGTNESPRARRAFYLTYNAAADGDFRATYYADKESEFEREGETFGEERVRISISDDFLGKPVVR
jgi:hypothetical protein